MILFIGSYCNNSSDGQSLKTKTYLNIFKKENVNFSFINTNKWSHHFVTILCRILVYYRKCDSILLMVSFRGARFLIPFINIINCKKKKKFSYSMIGTGPLAKHIRALGPKLGSEFVLNKKYGNFVDKRMKKNLQKLNYIFPETDLITELYRSFYDLNNCITITNFRDFLPLRKKISNGVQNIVFISRIIEEKGILDLIKAVNELKTIGIEYHLDIYGPIYFNKEYFMNLLKSNSNLKYCGILPFEFVIPTINKYDLICFPTKCPQEGAPGILIESLLAGTPVVCSDFPQVNQILKPNINCLTYNFGDYNELFNCLKKAKTFDFSKFSDSIFSSALLFSYEGNKKLIKDYILEE